MQLGMYTHMLGWIDWGFLSVKETVSYELHILVPVLKDCPSFLLYIRSHHIYLGQGY